MTRIAAFSYLAVSMVAATAQAQWSANSAVNLAVADLSSRQDLPKIAATTDGGCYISWFDINSGNYDVRLQRLDANGNEMWPHNGLLVSNNPALSSLVDYDLICDSNNHAVITFTDARNGTDRDIYAYRISPTQSFVWGANGLTLSSNNDFEADPRVIETSDGDFVFLWPQFGTTAPGLMMQRVTPDGTLLLAAGGLTVVSTPPQQPGFCELVASDNGAVVATWINDTRIPFGSRHVHAQKFAPNGSMIWGAAPLVVSNATAVPIAHRPRIVRAHNGAVIAWHDTRNGGLFDCWVQRIFANGNFTYPANGLQVSTNNTQMHLDPAIWFDDTINNVYVFWNERNTAQSAWGIYGQRIDNSGARLWSGGGSVLMPVNTVNKLSPRCVPVNGDSVVTVLEETGIQQKRVLAMRIGTSGGHVWSGSPRAVANSASDKARIPTTVNGCGQTMIAWEDNRTDASDVYAQNVRADGTLGPANWPAGDMNCDGIVNALDVSRFVTALLNPGAMASPCCPTSNGDMNASGTVDGDDVNAFVDAVIP